MIDVRYYYAILREDGVYLDDDDRFTARPCDAYFYDKQKPGVLEEDERWVRVTVIVDEIKEIKLD